MRCIQRVSFATFSPVTNIQRNVDESPFQLIKSMALLFSARPSGTGACSGAVSHRKPCAARTSSFCACSSIRWRLRALTEFPYDLRRISHSLCNNKQQNRGAAIAPMENFQAKHARARWRAAAGFIYFLRKPRDRPGHPFRGVSGNAITCTYTGPLTEAHSQAPVSVLSGERPARLLKV